MTLGCPQGYAEKVSLISQGKGANETERPPFPSECTENCRRSKLRVFLDESCELPFITLTELTIQRNKERFWQLEQTAKPKKANISL